MLDGVIPREMRNQIFRIYSAFLDAMKAAGFADPHKHAQQDCLCLAYRIGMLAIEPLQDASNGDSFKVRFAMVNSHGMRSEALRGQKLRHPIFCLSIAAFSLACKQHQGPDDLMLQFCSAYFRRFAKLREYGITYADISQMENFICEHFLMQMPVWTCFGVAADEILDRKLEQGGVWRRLHDHMQTTSMQVITTEKVKKAVLKKYSKAMDHDDIYFVERSYPDVDELTFLRHIYTACILAMNPSQCNEGSWKHFEKQVLKATGNLKQNGEVDALQRDHIYAYKRVVEQAEAHDDDAASQSMTPSRAKKRKSGAM